MNENKLTEINSKFYQECEVVILPTKEQRWNNGHDDRYACYSFVDKKLYSRQSNAYNWSLSHLYILSSEEIKEGESSWIINKNRDTIYFIKNAQKDEDELKGINKNWNKIIATTDILLTDYIKVEGGFGSCYNKLPRPSDDFLKAFVKAQGKIDKVLVEYEGFGFKRFDLEGKPRRAGYQLKIAQDNTITIKKKEEICQCCGKPLYIV